MSNVLARARIQVIVEIGDNGPYGKEWTVASIHKDAKERSMNVLSELLRSKGGQIVGEPKVVVMLIEESKQ